MKLTVLGKPFVDGMPKNRVTKQTIIVTYDPFKETTTVDCNVDIVTLGITVNVLLEQYESYLQQLSPEMAQKIKEATRKAVSDNEEYRSQDLKSRRS